MIKIANKLLGENQSCFIIAEAGVNHNGDVNLAKKLIDLAKEAGADAVKFQTWITEELMAKESPMAEYAKKNTKEISQFEMIKKLELSFDEFRELKKYADKKGIIFLSTPDEEISADFLYELGVPAFKIGSGELTNSFMLEHVAKKGLPIILSTGMGDLEEVRKAVEIINLCGNQNLVLLHCTTDYPAKIEEINLKAMQTLAKEFNTLVGYSDHTEGILVPSIAVVLGACVIEKHFTFDKNAEGPDHKASLNPDEFKEMVELIRKTEIILGNSVKKPAKSESANKEIVRKSIVARIDIPAGTKIIKEMLAAKRPGNGIKPNDINIIIGRIAKRIIKKNELIIMNDLK